MQFACCARVFEVELRTRWEVADPGVFNWLCALFLLSRWTVGCSHVLHVTSSHSDVLLCPCVLARTVRNSRASFVELCCAVTRTILGHQAMLGHQLER